MTKGAFLILLVLLFSVIPCVAENVPSQVKKNSLLLKISKSADDSTKVKDLSSLVELYPDLSSEKLKYIREGLTIAQNIKWKKGAGLFHYHLAWFHFFNNERDLAVENFLKATEFSDEVRIQVYSFGCLSSICSWERKHAEAIIFANKSVEAAEKSNSTTMKTDALLCLGDAYRYTGDKENAKFYYYQVFTLLDSKDLTKPSLSKMAAYVYLTESSLENPFGIFKYVMELKSIYDNGNSHEKQLFAFSLIKIALAYTASVESVKIKQLQLESEAKQANLYVAGISLLVVIAALLIWQNMIRKNANKKLEEANEMKSRFFGILNHDLRRPVAGLISYLQLKTVAPEIINPEESAAFEKKTIETAKNLLQNMEDLLFWCKDQMQGFTPEFTSVPITKLYKDTFDFFSYDENIPIVYHTPSDLKITTDENYVKTIMRNLTANAIAALQETENPRIEWTATKVNNKIILSITNNGPAIPDSRIRILYEKDATENIKEGLGLKIIRDLAKTIGCRIEVYRGKKTGIGTRFSLIFNQS